MASSARDYQASMGYRGSEGDYVAGAGWVGFAAILLGFVVGLQRRATGGILAPIITHLVWSVTMLYALPAIFLGAAT